MGPCGKSYHLSQDSQRFYRKDRLDTETLPARTQGCRGELNCSMANTRRYLVEKRQISFSAAGFGSATGEATDSLFCYCQEGSVVDQSHLFWVVFVIAVLVFTALQGEEDSFTASPEGCGSNWLLECGICPVFTGCSEHPPSSTSSAGQLQKDTGKILEMSFQLIFYLEVCLLILKKQLLVEGEIALIHQTFSTQFAWFFFNQIIWRWSHTTKCDQNSS